MNTRHTRTIAAMLAIAILGLSGCAPEAPRQSAQEDHYTSPVVKGESNAINLEAVEKAFWDAKGDNFNAKMAAFEKRVNEIYEGDGVVAIDAKRQNDRLVVNGFVDQNGQEGLQDADKKLFSIEQTGPATRDAVPVRVADGQGQVYREGSHSLMDNPFMQAFMMSAMFHWVGSYFTPRPQMVVLQNHQRDYRGSAGYKRQVLANREFNTRFKPKSSGSGYQSNKGFNGGASAQETPKRRSWSQPAANGNGNASSWSGRRSSGSGYSAPRRSSGWGGRRR